MNKFLIIGLGNIGAEYTQTRHNIGFKIVEKLIDSTENFILGRHAHIAKSKMKNKQIIILKPTTYMNLSGKAVKYWMDLEKIPLENILVITDDLALPFETLRLKGKGTHGGHNGLRNIIEILGTSEFARLRIGIGKDFKNGEQINYVLGKWSDEELKWLPNIFEKSIEIIQSFVLQGLDKTMNQHNKK